MRQKFTGRRLASCVLAAGMVLTAASPAMALEESQADEYTLQNLANAEKSTANDGTYFAEGTFDEGQDYSDETFETTADPEDTTFPDVYPKDKMTPMYGDELDAVIEGLVKSMTYEEKINMVSMNTDPEERSGVGYMTGIPRLGVPETRMHDGPAGISTSGDSYVETTNPPMQLTASMSWSTDLIYKYGEILGKEHKSTGSGWQLGTQMDLARTPHWARAKDTFGEDYYLTSQLAVAETKGVQENGGIAMGKHIGAYSTDGDTSLWLDVDDQTLHTAYLYPFEMAVKDGNLASIMGTYNRLNGYYVSSNTELQINILRNMWNFKGAMVPDWGADREAYSMPLGTTISQNNAQTIDPLFRSAVSQGIMTMDDLNEKVSETLYAYGVSGYLNLVELDENGYAKEEPGRTEPIRFERTYDEDRDAGLYEEDNAIAKEIAEKSITLLKNEDNTLPLTEEDYTGDNSVALVGFGAVNSVGGTGGERSVGVLEYMTSPYEEIMKIAGDDANISAYILDNVHGTSIPAEDVFQSEDGDETGWVRTNGILAEDVVEVSSGFPMPGAEEETEEETETQPIENPGSETGSLVGVEDTISLSTGAKSFKNTETGTALVDDEAYTWTGYIQAPVTGDYSLIIESNGGNASVKAVGDEVEEETETEAASAMPMMGGGAGSSDTATVSDGVSWDYYTTDGLNYSALKLHMTEGQRYKVVVTAQHTSPYRNQGVRLNWILPGQDEDDLAAAVEAARTNDTVVMFTRTGATGHGPVFQTDFDISLDEIDEIKAVQQAARENGNKFVLVVYSRSGFSFEGDWLDDTDALLVPYYAGQSSGAALAEILTGEVNPSGKLTMTLPKTNADTLLTYGYYGNDEEDTDYNTELAGDQSQETYTAHYEEGLNFGYRWYDAMDIEPQYAFGYGLSYTTFEYSDMSAVVNDDNTVDVTVTVTNTGDVTGDEIVQTYIGPAENVPDHVQQAEKQLCAFARVEDIAPGESKTVTMTISQRMLSYWDSEIDLIEREDGTKDKWVLAEGNREIMVGPSSDNLVWNTDVTIS